MAQKEQGSTDTKAKATGTVSEKPGPHVGPATRETTDDADLRRDLNEGPSGVGTTARR
jgi:hypothetical protein